MVVVNLFNSIKGLLNEHKNRVLTIAQVALPDSQFKAFRKMYLDETGDKGFEGELRNLLDKQHGVDRNGRE